MLKIYKGEQVPEERRKTIEEELRQYLGKDASFALTPEAMQEIAQQSAKTQDPNFSSHEEMVVSRMRTELDFQAFVVRWREHFLASMKPRHLPEHWDAYRPITKP